VVVVVELGEFVGDELGLIGLVVGVVATILSPDPLSLHNSLGLRPTLRAMTALAASRIDWVER
jgi:hypothetical protein